MGDADVGGDGSVMWVVDVDHVVSDKLKHEPKGAKGWKHEGVDETNDGEKFTVTIKIPRDSRDSAEFVRTLRAAADEAERHEGSPGHPVSFTLRIEHENHKQIRIHWDSKPNVITT